MSLNNVGAFWKKEKNGKGFYSGVIEIDKLVVQDGKAQILLYKNDYKEEDKHPDLKIFQVQEDEQSQQQSQEPDNESIPF